MNAYQMLTVWLLCVFFIRAKISAFFLCPSGNEGKHQTIHPNYEHAQQNNLQLHSWTKVCKNTLTGKKKSWWLSTLTTVSKQDLWHSFKLWCKGKIWHTLKKNTHRLTLRHTHTSDPPRTFHIPVRTGPFPDCYTTVWSTSLDHYYSSLGISVKSRKDLLSLR